LRGREFQQHLGMIFAGYNSRHFRKHIEEQLQMRHVTRLILVLASAILVGTSCATVPASTATPEPARAESTFPENPLRPPVIGRNAGVSAGHPLTTSAAMEILQQGGNAFDAGVAALLVGGVVEQDLYGIGGEALILVYPVAEGEVVSVNGQGWAPASANIDDYLRDGRTLQGQGLDPSVVPGALHGALTVLERWGTMSFEEVARRAIEYAEAGFPLRTRTADAIRREYDFISRWPYNRLTWLKADGSFFAEPGQDIPAHGRGGTRSGPDRRACRRHHRRTRPLLQRRYRRGNGLVPAEERCSVLDRGFRRVLCARRGTGVGQLSRL
jgi:hypothetical protein